MVVIGGGGGGGLELILRRYVQYFAYTFPSRYFHTATRPVHRYRESALPTKFLKRRDRKKEREREKSDLNGFWG